MLRKILLGLTTTPKSDWREKIREINKFGLKEIALFPTFLEIKDRKKLYNLLEKTGIKKIPHVHLRDDMESWELDYFYQKYKTRLFNIHSRPSDFSLIEKNEKYRSIIFVENGSSIVDQFVKLARDCGGLCFDTSHYHDSAILKKDTEYKIFLELCKELSVGCCHISSIVKKHEFVESLLTGKRIKTYSRHYLHDLSELDYVKNYVDYLPKIISIELENSFEEQLEVKKYLKKIIEQI